MGAVLNETSPPCKELNKHQIATFWHENQLNFNILAYGTKCWFISEPRVKILVLVDALKKAGCMWPAQLRRLDKLEMWCHRVQFEMRQSCVQAVSSTCGESHIPATKPSQSRTLMINVMPLPVESLLHTHSGGQAGVWSREQRLWTRYIGRLGLKRCCW